MSTQLDNDIGFNLSGRSSVYREIMAERRQIEDHKWLESEKAGQDIGYEKALFSWVRNHRTLWLQFRKTLNSKKTGE